MVILGVLIIMIVCLSAVAMIMRKYNLNQSSKKEEDILYKEDDYDKHKFI